MSVDLDDLEEGPPRVRRPSGRFQHRNSVRTDNMELQQAHSQLPPPPPPPATPLSISIHQSQSRPPPPLPSAPPPKLPSSPTHETLLRIQPLPFTASKKSKSKPTSIAIGTFEIPPPPPLDSDDDNNNAATLPMHKSHLHYEPRWVTF